jgi:hypothetical protein
MIPVRNVHLVFTLMRVLVISARNALQDIYVQVVQFVLILSMKLCMEDIPVLQATTVLKVA